MKKKLRRKTVKNMALALSAVVASSNIVPAMAMESVDNVEKTAEVVENIEATAEATNDEITEQSATLEDEITEQSATLEDENAENSTKTVENGQEVTAESVPVDPNTFEVTGENADQTNAKFIEVLNQLKTATDGTYTIIFGNDFTLNNDARWSLRDFTSKNSLKIIFTSNQTAGEQGADQPSRTISLGHMIEFPRATKNCEFIIDNLVFNFVGDSEGKRRLFANGNKITIENCQFNNSPTLFGGFFEYDRDVVNKNTVNITLRDVSGLRDIQLCSYGNGGVKNNFTDVSLTLGGKVTVTESGINIGGYVTGSNPAPGRVEKLNIIIEKNAVVTLNRHGILSNDQGAFKPNNFPINNINYNIEGKIAVGALGGNNLDNAVINGYIDLTKVENISANILSGKRLDGLTIALNGTDNQTKITNLLTGVSTGSTVSVVFDGGFNGDNLVKIAELVNGSSNNLSVDQVYFRNFSVDGGTEIQDWTINDPTTFQAFLNNTTFVAEADDDFAKIVEVIKKASQDITVKFKKANEEIVYLDKTSIGTEQSAKKLISYITKATSDGSTECIVEPQEVFTQGQDSTETIENNLADLHKTFDHFKTFAGQDSEIILDLSGAENGISDLSGLFDGISDVAAAPGSQRSVDQGAQQSEAETKKANLEKISSIKVGDELTTLFGNNAADVKAWMDSNPQSAPSITGTISLSSLEDGETGQNFKFENLELKFGVQKAPAEQLPAGRTSRNPQVQAKSEAEKAFELMGDANTASTFGLGFYGATTPVLGETTQAPTQPEAGQGGAGAVAEETQVEAQGITETKVKAITYSPETTTISANTFKGVSFGDTFKHNIPDTVTTIGANAFDGQTVVGNLVINGLSAESVQVSDRTIDGAAFTNATLGTEQEPLVLINRVGTDNIDNVKTMLSAATKGNIIADVEENQDVKDKIASITTTNPQMIINSSAFEVEQVMATFEPNGGVFTDQTSDSRVTSVDKNTKVSPIEVTNPGFTLNGWYKVNADGSTEKDKFNFETTPITEPIKLRAIWDGVSNNITFDFNGGTKDNENQKILSLTSGNPVKQLLDSVQDVTKPNLTFANWYEVSGADASINYDDADPYNLDEDIISAVYLKAGWKATITFETGDDATTVDPQEVFEGKTATQPEEPTREGYNFVGWTKGDEKFDFSTEITGHTVLTAQWEAIETNPNPEVTTTHTVTFDFNGGTKDGAEEKVLELQDGLSVKELLTSVQDVTKPNLTFANWYEVNGADASINYDDADPYNLDKEVSSEVYLKAGWKATITFETGDDATTVDPQEVFEGKTATQPEEPTREGYNFVGWTKGDEKFDFSTEITGHTVLTAQWEAIETNPNPEVTTTHTVTFDFNGGTKDGAEEKVLELQDGLSVKELLTSVQDVTKPNLTFANWYEVNGADASINYDDADPYNLDKEVSSEVYLKAGWKATVTFETGADATTVDPQEVFEGKTATQPEEPTREGYNFVGWKKGDEKFDFSTEITGHTVLTAQWEAIETNPNPEVTTTHTVTFDADGGTFAKETDNSQDVTAGGKVNKPTDPTKEGHNFLGWYEVEGENLSAIPYNFNTSVTKGITLKAKWEIDSKNYATTNYTVKFETNGGNTIDQVEVKVLDKLSEKIPTPTKSRFTFKGWYVDAELKTPFDGYTPTEGSSITLYASWQSVPSSGGTGGGSILVGSTTPKTEENTTTEDTTPAAETTTQGQTQTQTQILSKAVISLPKINEEKAISFADVQETHWAASTIKKLAQSEIIVGNASGEFNPKGNSKRADVTIMLVKLLGLEGKTPTSNFNDVSADKYYAKYVGIAREYGIVNGNNGNFNPESNITREDAMVMTANILKALGIEINNDTTQLEEYKDFALISNYAKESVAILVNAGVISGSNGNISPKVDVTRAEMTVILSKLYDLLKKNNIKNN